MKSTIDTTITKDNKIGNSIEVVLAEQKNGVVIGEVSDTDLRANTVSAIVVTKVGTGVIAQTGTALKTKVETCDGIDDRTLNDLYAQLCDDTAGTNRALAVTAKVLKTSYEGSVKSDLIEDKDYIVYYVGADAQLDSDGNSIIKSAKEAKGTSQK